MKAIDDPRACDSIGNARLLKLISRINLIESS